jgi:hypothetical protein
MDIAQFTNSMIASLTGRSNVLEKAEEIAQRYQLDNKHYLHDILMVIASFATSHVDVERSDLETRGKLKEIRKAARDLNAAARRIRKLEAVYLLGGSLLAIEDEPDCFSALELLHLVLRRETRTGRILESSSAALAAFVKPLCEYWFDSTGNYPDGAFAGRELAFAPVPGTAAAFVVDCLRASGWSYSDERVADQFMRQRERMVAELGSGTLQ